MLFSKLKLSDRSWYEELYRETSQPYADLSFGNCIIWLNLWKDLEFCRYNDLVLLRYTNPFTKHKSLTFFGSSTKSEMECFLQRVCERNTTTFFTEIPQNIVDIAIKLGAKVCEERDGFEYILSTKEHYMLNERKYSRQRNQIKYFEGRVQPKLVETRVLTRLNAGLRKEIEDNVARWGMTVKSLSPPNSDNLEHIAIGNSLKYFSEIGQKLFIVSVRGRPVAYIFFRNICRNYVNISHLKVDYANKYIFDYSLHRFASYLYDNNTAYINFEQDLGIQGIRQHKLLSRPVRLLKKYSFSVEQPQ